MREILEGIESKRVTSFLDGNTKKSAVKILQDIRGTSLNGFFSDAYWKPINRMFERFTSKNIIFSIDKTEYKKDKDGNPISKTWYLSFPFLDKNEKEKTIYGTVVAAGAGSVDDPLGKYDVTFYMSE